MRTISWQLTMPNVGSWNGKWTGEDRKYYFVESISDMYLKSKEYFEDLLEKGHDSWHYDFGDGWCANVKAEIIDAAEAKKRRKQTVGFAGYDWMIRSVKMYGVILNSKQQQNSPNLY